MKPPPFLSSVTEGVMTVSPCDSRFCLSSGAESDMMTVSPVDKRLQANP